MKPAPFRPFAPTTVDECVELLSNHGDDAKLLAGGQSLVPLMNLRLAAPEVLIDLGRVEELRRVSEDDSHLVIGAMVRHSEVASSAAVRAGCPLLAEAASHIGYPAIRNRGTMGGSLAHADPASELPCVALTLDAELVLAGPRGRRTVPAADFFISHFTTKLEPDELLLEARYPLQRIGRGWSFLEFSRKTGDFAVAAVTVELPLDSGDGPARVGVAGVGERPWRATDAEALLAGGRPDADTVREAGRRAGQQALVAAEGHPDVGYRAHVVQTLVTRAVSRALQETEER